MDSPNAIETINRLIGNDEVMRSKMGGMGVSVSSASSVKNEYPSLEKEDEADDEEIMRLMSEAKVNN